VTTIVIAPDSFKGTATASAAADAIARGWASVRSDDELILRPMADGGEGTLDTFDSCTPGAIRMPTTVIGPDGRPVESEWLLLPEGAAVVELARGSGLHLLDPLLPLDAHSLGFGQLIDAACDAGATRLFLGIGGSASTDGGVGMLTALGAAFLDARGDPIPPGNRGLAALASVDLGGIRTAPAGSIALTDVTNPMIGRHGAARVYGPQKGAAQADLDAMDVNLTHLADVLDLRSLAAESSTGAAGGVGFALEVWGVALEPGSRTVGALVGLPAAIAPAQLVITGEGRYDEQSASGKVPHYVISIADAARVPTALVAGEVDARSDAFAHVVSLSTLAGSPASARSDALRWLTEAGEGLARSFTKAG
jgi:glycerate kinase